MAYRVRKDIIEVTGQFYAAIDKFLGNMILKTFIEPATKSMLPLVSPPKELTEAEVKDVGVKNLVEFMQLAEKEEMIGIIPAITLGLSNMLSFFLSMLDISGMVREKNILQPYRKFLRPNLLDTGSALNARLRDYIDEDRLKDILGKSGVKKEDVEILQKLMLYIPSASDIIQFAVREVYSPEKWGEPAPTQGFDTVMDLAKDDIKKAGLTEDTFRKYWIQHWRLPGLREGYEMLHRKAIDPEDLDRLMIMQDIMPEWVEPLKKISYSPYTRVDVRRMHKLGVLFDDDLQKAYEDLGYDEEKAANMAEFTIRYNAESPTEDLTLIEEDNVKHRELTRSDILRSYRLQLITRDKAKAYLKTIGYLEDAVEFYLAIEDYKKDEEELSKYLDYYKSAFIKGIWDKTKTITMLGTLDLPDTYVSQLMQEWELEKEIKVNLPSRADLDKFLKKGIISKEVYAEEMRKHKYTDRYIEWYAASALSVGAD